MELVGEKVPLDDTRETHGICLAHRRQIQIRWLESGTILTGPGTTPNPSMSSILFRWKGLLRVTKRADL